MEIGIDMEKINTQMGWDGHFGFITKTLVKRIVSVHKIFSRKFASIHIKQI